jgi:glycogen debranching enzyme
MMTFRNVHIYNILLIIVITSSTCLSQQVNDNISPLNTSQGTNKHLVAKANHNVPHIGFVSGQSLENSETEIKLAYGQLKIYSDFTSEYLTFSSLVKQSKKTGRFAVIWIHCLDTTALSLSKTNEKLLKVLRSYVENGGKLLLTLQAVHYLNAVGFETEMFQDSTKPCLDDGYGRRLGVHAFRQHPLFTGLNGGAYLNRPLSDTTVRITGYFGNKIPCTGKVIAVDWDYIFLREDSKLVFEYNPGKGRVIAVGGYMNFSIPNSNIAQLSLFTHNCFKYLNGSFRGQPEFYWNYDPKQVTACPALAESDQLLVAVPPSKKWNTPTSELSLKRRFASENFWDVAGERLLTMGTEKGGIEEVWAHPFMAFRDYEVGIKFDYRDTILWLNDERPEIEVQPSFFSRQYKFQRAYLKEVVVNHPTGPNGVIHYEYRGVYGAELIIRFKSNLRWMWPYSERVTGSICHAWDYDLNAMVISDQSGDLNLIMGGTRKPIYHQSGQFDRFTNIRIEGSFQGIPTRKIQIAGVFGYKLDMNDNLDIVFSASTDGFKDTYAQFNNSIHDPEQIFRNALHHTDEILSGSLMMDTPEPEFNLGYRWAVLATDRFFINTPGMGKALAAGYSTTAHGWDGNHLVNGRPGYGWYFGRDAEWSSFALLDYGDFAKVKSQLSFFNKFQDLNGKIFHDASTSGLIHYDAADATPLYIVLAGKYFRHTNDTAFLRKTWPGVKRAINFCFSTDTDHDHLIENTNVGHGWVEGGELYGSHATIYMAGAWGAALKEASNMAVFMKDIAAEGYLLEANELSKIIDNNFWSDERQYFAYGMNKDGSFRQEQTILPAVPIYFRMADQKKASLALKNIAGNAFTTNWGVRILREDSPFFKPTGYHYGSVWPLFTGWASLAEYATGNPIQGFSHLMNNLSIYKNWGLGFVEEVLNGAEYHPSGVCAHQCWSETMVLQPAIEGMLGLDINARERKIHLAPQLPAEWDSLTVRNIRMADQSLNYRFKRTSGSCQYFFMLNTGDPVRIEFMPGFAAGTRFTKITLDDKIIPFTTFKSAQSMTLMLTFDVSSNSKLVVDTEAGIAVLSAVPDPKPGDLAEGMRILSAGLSGNVYRVETEGKAGSTWILKFWSQGEDLLRVENARFLDRKGPVQIFAVDFEPSGLKYVSKIVTVTLKQ